MEKTWGAVVAAESIAYSVWYRSDQAFLEALQVHEPERAPLNGDHGHILVKIDAAARQYNQCFGRDCKILWWGPFTDLCESEGAVPSSVRIIFHEVWGRGHVCSDPVDLEDYSAFFSFLKTAVHSRSSIG